MKLTIEKCDYWNGKDRVCDNQRCIKRKGFPKYYHKPFKINGKFTTVKNAVLELLK